ncbi:uncharacterized protein CLUP02_15593 [Colletotrichum lupini]|uniref:Uncharacterized protein n=1 Tax=Colletotrichum lupini TaxID=145971 RepID=A0A9Q8T8A4_9PEZI|nr:uncharacterized protein CLUP02_15593 [Colletotrichum lupini]UQC90062.1 hypothetical protein CLUP02_15593 [Colletotrichum lupini]
MELPSTTSLKRLAIHHRPTLCGLLLHLPAITDQIHLSSIGFTTDHIISIRWYGTIYSKSYHKPALINSTLGQDDANLLHDGHPCWNHVLRVLLSCGRPVERHNMSPELSEPSRIKTIFEMLRKEWGIWIDAFFSHIANIQDPTPDDLPSDGDHANMKTAALSNNTAQAATKVQEQAPYFVEISCKFRTFVASRKSVLLGNSFLIFSNSEKMQPSADTANMNDKTARIALAKVCQVAHSSAFYRGGKPDDHGADNGGWIIARRASDSKTSLPKSRTIDGPIDPPAPRLVASNVKIDKLVLGTDMQVARRSPKEATSKAAPTAANSRGDGIVSNPLGVPYYPIIALSVIRAFLIFRGSEILGSAMRARSRNMYAESLESPYTFLPCPYMVFQVVPKSFGTYCYVQVINFPPSFSRITWVAISKPCSDSFLTKGDFESGHIRQEAKTAKLILNTLPNVSPISTPRTWVNFLRCSPYFRYDSPGNFDCTHLSRALSASTRKMLSRLSSISGTLLNLAGRLPVHPFHRDRVAFGAHNLLRPPSSFFSGVVGSITPSCQARPSQISSSLVRFPQLLPVNPFFKVNTAFKGQERRNFGRNEAFLASFFHRENSEQQSQAARHPFPRHHLGEKTLFINLRVSPAARLTPMAIAKEGAFSVSIASGPLGRGDTPGNSRKFGCLARDPLPNPWHEDCVPEQVD